MEKNFTQKQKKIVTDSLIRMLQEVEKCHYEGKNEDTQRLSKLNKMITAASSVFAEEKLKNENQD